MEEHNILFVERTFKELEDNTPSNYKDPYSIMSSLGPKMREALLNNPSGVRDDETCQILALDNDVVVGNVNSFSGRLKLRDEILPVQNGSHLFSHESYRKDNVGGELFLNLTNLHPTKNNFYSGISNMALPIYKALKYTIIEFPRLIYLRKSRSVIHSLLNTESVLTKPVIWLADTCLWLHRTIIQKLTDIRLRNYKVEEVKEVPIEIEGIVVKDKHPFMEYHDKAWFEWSLK